ncbi:MAG: hypothetical protein HKO58_04030 [Gammaproteobacteria bacterium]|nr:hypothetical protein [Gammaproteobacteria bacterium]
MKTTRLEKFVLFGICMSFCYYAFAGEVNASDVNDDSELFLWFSELSTEEAELLVKQDPEQLEQKLESAKTLFAQAEEARQETDNEFLTPETDISEDRKHEPTE